MKTTVLAVVLLAAAGWLGLGQPPERLWEPWMGIPEGAGGGPVEVGSSFQIPGSFLMWSDGDLAFSGEQLVKVTDPAYLGWATANTLYVYWVTNIAVRITREVWAYKGQGTCAKLLPTYTHWLAYVWQGQSWSGSPVRFVGGYVEANPPVTGYRTDSFEFSACEAGYYMSKTWIYPRRDGYNDPTDTYVARVRFTISGI